MQARDAEPGAVPLLPCVSGAGTLRQARLHDARLVVVTDTRADRNDLERFLDLILAASVDVVRLRALALDDAELTVAARTARRVCDRHGALLLLDDRPTIAVDAGADGVHLGRRGAPLSEIRTTIGPDLLLGRSTRDVRDLARSADEDLDHVTVPAGPAAGPVRDLHAVRHAATSSPHLWFAAGGIGPGTIGRVLAAGARRVVAGAAVTRADDPAEVAWTLRRALARYPLPS